MRWRTRNPSGGATTLRTHHRPTRPLHGMPAVQVTNTRQLQPSRRWTSRGGVAFSATPYSASFRTPQPHRGGRQQLVPGRIRHRSNIHRYPMCSGLRRGRGGHGRLRHLEPREPARVPCPTLPCGQPDQHSEGCSQMPDMASAGGSGTGRSSHQRSLRCM